MFSCAMHEFANKSVNNEKRILNMKNILRIQTDDRRDKRSEMHARGDRQADAERETVNYGETKRWT